jgi:hypothetical protein
MGVLPKELILYRKGRFYNWPIPVVVLLRDSVSAGKDFRNAFNALLNHLVIGDNRVINRIEIWNRIAVQQESQAQKEKGVLKPLDIFDDQRILLYLLLSINELRISTNVRMRLLI